MAEVIINGPVGLLEGRYTKSMNQNDAPIALVLHPHPVHGGTMNNTVVYNTYKTLALNGYTVLRINFRGVGLSAGSFANGEGELVDAATALDWLEDNNPNARHRVIAGFSFGAWIAMEILMRRPEIDNFIAISPPVKKYDFGFLSPCPESGIVIQGDLDSVVEEEDVAEFVNKINAYKNVNVEYKVIQNADHFFRNKIVELNKVLDDYIKSCAKNSLQNANKTDKLEEIDINVDENPEEDKMFL